VHERDFYYGFAANLKALLLVAHGSRRRESNEEIAILTQRVRECAGGRFDLVTCAFLELAEPSIPDGIDNAVPGHS